MGLKKKKLKPLLKFFGFRQFMLKPNKFIKQKSISEFLFIYLFKITGQIKILQTKKKVIKAL